MTYMCVIRRLKVNEHDDDDDDEPEELLIASKHSYNTPPLWAL